jgi:spore coat protein U-like protein
MKIIPHNLFAALLLALLPGTLFCTQVHAETLTISAVVVSKGNCSFNNNAATLDFGTLNPLNPQDISADTGDQLSFICRGGGKDDITFSITVSGSQHGTPVAPAMRHQGGLFDLPYQLSLDPAFDNTSKNIDLPLVVTGTILGGNYILAPVGTYSDTATLSINP